MTTPRLSALLAGRALGRAAGGPGGWAVRGAIPTGGIESPTSQRAAAAFASAAAGAVMAATVRGTPPHPSRVARTAVAFSSAAATVLPPAAHHPLPPPPRRSTSALLAAAACVALGGLGSLTLAPTARHTARAQEDERVVATPSLTDAAPWVKELAAGDGVVQILSADDLEKQAHAFLRADHVVRKNKRKEREREGEEREREREREREGERKQAHVGRSPLESDQRLPEEGYQRVARPALPPSTRNCGWMEKRKSVVPNLRPPHVLLPRPPPM